MLTEYETYLPIFPGFYCTFFDDDYYESDLIGEEMSNLAEEYDIDKDIIEALQIKGNSDYVTFDYPAWHEEAAKECCRWVEERLQDILGEDCKVEYEEIHSPREYNFANDSIHCKITLDDCALAKYILEHREAFEEYLKKNYTPCDGFIPHYSNFIEDWIPAEVLAMDPATENFAEIYEKFAVGATSNSVDDSSKFELGGGHQTGSMLEFVLRNYYHEKVDEDENNIESDLYYDVSENVWLGGYLVIKPELLDLLKLKIVHDLSNEYRKQYQVMSQFVEKQFKGDYHKIKTEKERLAREWLDPELDYVLDKVEEIGIENLEKVPNLPKEELENVKEA